MSIEVKQLQIRTAVEQGADSGGSTAFPVADQEEMKAEILAECRQMMRELLREAQER